MGIFIQRKVVGEVLAPHQKGQTSYIEQTNYLEVKQKLMRLNYVIQLDRFNAETIGLVKGFDENDLRFLEKTPPGKSLLEELLRYLPKKAGATDDFEGDSGYLSMIDQSRRENDAAYAKKQEAGGDLVQAIMLARESYLQEAKSLA